MSVTAAADAWLGRVNHDLVKRLLWPARDRRDLGGAPAPGELVAALIDGEGQPTSAAALWQELCADAPASIPAAALARFGGAVAAAVAAAHAGDLDGVLALAEAHAALARNVK